jgi:hypothetical protein
MFVYRPELKISGMVFMGIGVLSFCCVYCWAKFIPFTVKILQEVGKIVKRHSGVVLVGAAGAFTSICWCLMCGVFVAKALVNTSTNTYLILFLAAVLFTWGGLVGQNVTHVTNCGVVGQAICGRSESVRTSLKVAMTTSFGSVCFGSLIVAVIQGVQTVLNALKNQARENQNIAALVVVCVLECIVSCIRDIADAFSYFAYVQVAVRGLSFLNSVKATWALCTFKNVFSVLSCCLVRNVASMGSIICGLCAAIIGVFVGRYAVKDFDSVNDTKFNATMLSAAVCTLLGLFIAGNVLSILLSGFATVLVLWAEDPLLLRQNTNLQELDRSFSSRAALSTSQ